MPEYIGVSREKCTWLSSIWFDVFGSSAPAGRADDSNAITIKQKQPELVTGFFISCVCVCRQRGGDAKCKREDRRVKGSGFNQIKPSLTEEQYIIQAKCYCYSFFSLRFSLVAVRVEHKNQAEWFEYTRIWAVCWGFHFSSFFLPPPLYQREGIPLTLGLISWKVYRCFVCNIKITHS